MTLTWPNKVKGDPSKRPRNTYYYFHRDHGHDTFECYGLKQQIEVLIKQGKLQRFVKGRENSLRDPEPNQWVEERPRISLGEIRVIVGGNTTAGSFKKARKTYLRMMQSVQIFGRPPKAMKVDNPTINFIEEDARRLHHPYDDALVISLSITDRR